MKIIVGAYAHIRWLVSVVVMEHTRRRHLVQKAATGSTVQRAQVLKDTWKVSEQNMLTYRKTTIIWWHVPMLGRASKMDAETCVELGHVVGKLGEVVCRRAGRRTTSSKVIPRVSEQRCPILISLRPTLMPARARGRAFGLHVGEQRKIGARARASLREVCKTHR
eukprot:2298236-Pleurochrysis_carterae.AAC.7